MRVISNMAKDECYTILRSRCKRMRLYGNAKLQPKLIQVSTSQALSILPELQ